MELATCERDKEKFIELRTSYNKDKTPEKLWALMLSCTSNLMRFNKNFYLIKHGVSVVGIIIRQKNQRIY